MPSLLNGIAFAYSSLLSLGQVNPVREKELTNVRAVGKDEKVHMIPARVMGLEEMLAYMRGSVVVLRAMCVWWWCCYYLVISDGRTPDR